MIWLKRVYRLINPCERATSRVGEWISVLASGTDCRCCLGARILLALVAGVVIGKVL